jgi:hypothetical protein
MTDRFSTWLAPVNELQWWKFGLRCIWVAVQLVAVYCFANQVGAFFYQRF